MRFSWVFLLSLALVVIAQENDDVADDQSPEKIENDEDEKRIVKKDDGNDDEEEEELLPLCPMLEHQICNGKSEAHACVCSVSPLDPEAVPFQSCNNLIERDELKEFAFEAVSVEFGLKDVVFKDGFPEEDFKKTIASSLKVDEEDLLLLRVSCLNETEKLTVQFGILKKNVNSSDIPYDEDQFVDVDSIVTRLNEFGHLETIADMQVENFEKVSELIPIEFEPDNTELFVQALLTAAAFGFMFLLGLYKCIRNRNYSDELQKA